MGGILSPGLVRLLYYHGMSKLGAPVNSSIYCIYPLYSTLIALVWLDEVLTVWSAVGIACILLGIVAMELNNYHRNSRGRAEWRNIVFPVLGGVTFGVSTVIRKVALDLWNVPVLGVAVGYTFALLPYAFLLLSAVPVRRQLRLRQDFRWFWIVGITQAITWILAFYALSFEEVSITIPLMSVEPLFVVAFAYLYLKRIENVTHQLLGSVLLTVFGVVLVTI